MNVYTTSYFKRKFRKLTKKDKTLARDIDKKFNIFTYNPLHPSLRLHKLSGDNLSSWSISIKGNLRIIFQYVEDGVLITDIGSHDDVY